MSDIADALVSRGWAVDPAFLDPASVTALRDEIAAADAAGAFRPAGIGRGTGAAIRPDVRGDRILWLEPPHPLLERFESWSVTSRSTRQPGFIASTSIAIRAPMRGSSRWCST
jgi:hypothetical protein